MVLVVQLSLEVVAAVCRQTQGMLELPPAVEAAAEQQVQQMERSAKRRRVSGKALAGRLQQLSRSESRGGTQQDLMPMHPAEDRGRVSLSGTNS